MATINEVQDAIIEEFSLFAGDREAITEYIFEMGLKLAPLAEEHKVSQNVIKGCQSTVWLVADLVDGKIIFSADSNTGITKGLISMLLRIFSDRSPEEILNTELYFLEKIGMSGIISSQRSNGLTAMIKQIKLYALAFQAKAKANA
ncbi:MULTISPECIES: SufE family protein [Persicobacter]|uniref:Fe-S metabolism protein SufE n=1 Tax=Persicobacter diffluens TaxID=981 RepID=A0AAN5ALH7_9BACT|nr:SufE family protein [Persicobacter sp. CCB-QB2]GJM60883.1 Fe-S metabolism protein SufE [Persicobacter diffluens]